MPVATGLDLRRASPSVAPAGNQLPVPVVPRRRRGPGRDLRAAITVGVSLAALVVLSLVLRKEAFVGVVAVAMVIALHEMGQAFATRRIRVPMGPLLLGAVGMQVAAYTGGQEALLVAFLLTVVGVVLWRAVHTVEGAVRDVAAAVFSAAYVPLLGGFALLMLAEDDGPLRIVVFVLSTVASDIGGYVFGVLWGRHPMAPSVSPKKSWEGSAGSAVFTMAAGVAGVVFLLDGPWWAGILTGIAVTVSATVGDLSESLLKRDIGIKDMGSLLPGHGGLMDRLDSLLLTAPVMYLLLTAFVPVAA
jgi:phosphatidate cytidylyltransferase